MPNRFRNFLWLWLDDHVRPMPSALDLTCRLTADLGMDAGAIGDLVAAIDARFGFPSHSPAADDLTTIGDVLVYCVASARICELLDAGSIRFVAAPSIVPVMGRVRASEGAR